jgi:light-regulated signal transduction histidine kinase (bacteriophytochrome)
MLQYLRIIQQPNNYSKFLLEEIANDLSFIFRNQELSLIFTGFEGKVFLDKNKFSAVLKELIQNSIKFSNKERTKITITCINNGVNLDLIVEDNGPGIDESFSEKIFKVYATLERRDDFESIGIGLAVVKRFMEDLHGDIKLLPSSGAKFNLKIPI